MQLNCSYVPISTTMKIYYYNIVIVEHYFYKHVWGVFFLQAIALASAVFVFSVEFWFLFSYIVHRYFNVDNNMIGINTIARDKRRRRRHRRRVK